MFIHKEYPFVVSCKDASAILCKELVGSSLYFYLDFSHKRKTMCKREITIKTNILHADGENIQSFL